MATRIFIVIASVLLSAIFCILVYFRYSSQIVTGFVNHAVIYAGILLLSLVPTGVLWFKLRHRAELRSWLPLKLAGNSVFFFAVAAAWLLDLPAKVMFLGMWLAFILWAIGMRRLLEARHRSKTQVEPNQK